MEIDFLSGIAETLHVDPGSKVAEIHQKAANFHWRDPDQIREGLKVSISLLV